MLLTHRWCVSVTHLWYHKFLKKNLNRQIGGSLCHMLLMVAVVKLLRPRSQFYLHQTRLITWLTQGRATRRGKCSWGESSRSLCPVAALVCVKV